MTWDSIGKLKGGVLSIWGVLAFLVVCIIVVMGVVFIQEGTRKIPVQHSKRIVGRRSMAEMLRSSKGQPGGRYSNYLCNLDHDGPNDHCAVYAAVGLCKIYRQVLWLYINRIQYCLPASDHPVYILLHKCDI